MPLVAVHQPCSVAHLFASLMAIESSQGIAVTQQTKALRRLAYNGLMIRDHGLQLYFFVLPDVLGVDSILDVSDDPVDIGHTLLHDTFDIKRLGTDISNATVGAAIHAPWPTVGDSCLVEGGPLPPHQALVGVLRNFAEDRLGTRPPGPRRKSSALPTGELSSHALCSAILDRLTPRIFWSILLS